jgi:hypothetical protein
VKFAPRRWRSPLVLTGLLLLAGLSAPTAWAAPGQAIGKVIASDNPPELAGVTKSYTFELRPTSGQISSFNLTAAGGWVITKFLQPAPPSGVSLFPPTSSTQIRGRGVTITSSSPLFVTFEAQAPCATTNPDWDLVARSGPNFNGSTFAIDTTQSVLSTPITDKCTATFVAGRGPADAAFNGGNKSQNITSDPYDPAGNAMQVIVNDATGRPRAGILITLALMCTPPDSVCKPAEGGASLVPAIVGATSDVNGIATFGSVAIDEVGIGYQLNPTGNGVTSTPSSAFGIYEEGKTCDSPPCSVNARSDDGDIAATVTADAPSGSPTLSALVSPLDVDCEDPETTSIPADYEYQALSAEVVAWKYTGTGTQTISVLVDKSLVHSQTDRGNDIDVCFLVEGLIPGTNKAKSFVDKFGRTRTEASGPGLLPLCSPTITHDCIVSETAVSGGDRLITFTVDDGRGKI